MCTTRMGCPNTKYARCASHPPDPESVLAAYIGLYVVGMLAGLAAKMAFDVQLGRPGTRQVVGLVLVVLLVWGAISITHTPFSDVLLPLLWAGTGLLAGFGSR